MFLHIPIGIDDFRVIREQGQDLAIWRAGEAYRAHFQRYPVIHFNFKAARGDTFEQCWASIRAKIVDLYDEHRQCWTAGG